MRRMSILSNTEIRDYVISWYATHEQSITRQEQQTKNLISTIESTPYLQSIAQSPLLLNILIAIHHSETQLPHERVKLYEKCVTALLDSWDEVKKLTIEDKQRPFYKARRRLLEQLAFYLHSNAEEPGREQSIREGDLELLLTRFLLDDEELPLRGKPNAAREEARALPLAGNGKYGITGRARRGRLRLPPPHVLGVFHGQRHRATHDLGRSGCNLARYRAPPDGPTLARGHSAASRQTKPICALAYPPC